MNHGPLAKCFEICFALYGSLIILIFVHEIGHLLVGLACDLQLVTIRVGSLKFQNTQGCKLSRRWRDAFSGAIVIRAGKHPQSRLCLRYFLFVLGGPVANITFGFLATLLIRQKGASADIGGILVGGSFLLATINLIPQSSRGIETDGEKLWKLLSSRRRRDEVIFGLTVANRLEEARELYDTGQFQNALEKVEAIVQESEAFPKLSKNAEFMNVLRRFQVAMQKTVVGENHGEHHISPIGSLPIEP